MSRPASATAAVLAAARLALQQQPQQQLQPLAVQLCSSLLLHSRGLWCGGAGGTQAAHTASALASAAARAASGQQCSTSTTPQQQQHHHQQQQQQRSYAKAAGGKTAGGKKAAAAAPPPPPSKDAAADDLAPPAFTLKRVPQVYKGDPLALATDPQKAVLQSLSGSGAPLRSLRQVGWPLGPQEVLALWHEQLSDAAGSSVQMTPFVLESVFQSAAALATLVAEFVEKGRGMPQVEQALLMMIANTPPEQLPLEGIKVLLKGRMSGKGGKAAKKVWEWGRTSTSCVSDPVDYAHEAVVTRAGYIGIKVWIKYKRSHMAAQAQRSNRSAVSVAQVLDMPAPLSLPSRSRSGWWSLPGPLQPQQHRSWAAFKPAYDPLTGGWARRQQQQQRDGGAQPSAPAAADGGSEASGGR